MGARDNPGYELGKVEVFFKQTKSPIATYSSRATRCNLCCH